MIWNTPPSFLVDNNVILLISWCFRGKIMYNRFFACDYNPVLLLNISRHKYFIVYYLLEIDGSHVKTPRLILWRLISWMTRLEIKAFLIANFNRRERWRLHFFSYGEFVVHYYLRFWNYFEWTCWIERVFCAWSFLNISNLIDKSLSHWRFITLILKWI